MQGKKGLKMKSSRISALAAWALAFGCAIGWDAIALPWTTFLPMAGPVGMAIGILIGAVAMGVIAWNYHYMINRNPGPGGAYTYAAKAFGSDHGFICAWFLCLVYTAIVWMDAVALVIVSQFAFGDLMRFGFHMTVAGHEVSLGHVVLSSAAIAVSAAACCRRSLSCHAQIAFVALLSVGIVACFWSTLAVHDGGIGSVLPAFAPDGGSPVWQVLRIVSVAPWLFVGFEAISQSSAEFGFPHRRSFLVMTSALAAATLGYVLLTAVPVLAPASGGWVQTVREMGPNVELHAFAAAGGSAKTTVRTITEIRVERQEEDILLTVSGNAFLYNMVRIIAGTLIDIGHGKLPSGAMQKALDTGDRLQLGVTAPPQGLTLA